MTFDELNTTLEPEITAGSKIEIAGSLYEFTALEDIDPDADWAGFGNSTLIYCKIVTGGGGDTCTSKLTTTKPTWNSAKQGFYDGSDRYYGYIYKNSNGDYTRKYIYGLLSDGGHNLNEVGDIAWCCTQYKPGYIIADGSTISWTTNPEYSRLVHLLKMEALADAGHPFYHADADKAVLPDLNGRSLRAVDVAGTRDQDGTRDAGDYQADEIKAHTHTGYANIKSAAGGSSLYFNTGALDNDGSAYVSYSSPISIATQGNTENTVKNITMWGLIKF